MPFVRAEQQSRLRSAERALAELGRINPLALEEFAALEDRHRFLSEQLDDLTKTRHDLLDIIKEVDKRVEEVFAAAYADVAREFEHIFARLFPGGEGRLMLTEPTDLLASGIEVEARPPARRSSACRCFPAASGHLLPLPSWWRCSRRGPPRSTSSTR